MIGKYAAICVAGSLVVPGALRDTDQRKDRHWETPVSLCGLSFMIGADWVATRDSGRMAAGECRASVKHRRYDKLVERNAPQHFWMIAVAVEPRSFDETTEYHEVRREGQRWFVGEGAREAPAYEIKGRGWWGLRVDSLSFRSGPREGSGSFESGGTFVVISPNADRRTVTLLAGNGADDEALPLLLSTLTVDSKR